MADFRCYAGMDASAFLCHYGVGHEDGGHSGRYKWGTGDRSKQSEEKSLRERVSEYFSKENRLQRYKNRALRYINRRYDRRIKFMEDASTAQKEYSTRKEAKKPNDAKLKEKNDRIEREMEFELAALKVMKAKEVKAVMKMKYNDKEMEVLAVAISMGKNYLRTSFAVGVGGIVLGPLGATIGNIYAMVNRNRLVDAKSAYRLNGTTERHHEQLFKERHRREIQAKMRKRESDDKYAYAIPSKVKSRIKSMYNGGLSQAEIAERLGISPSSVSRVVSA